MKDDEASASILRYEMLRWARHAPLADTSLCLQVVSSLIHWRAPPPCFLLIPTVPRPTYLTYHMSTVSPPKFTTRPNNEPCTQGATTIAFLEQRPWNPRLLSWARVTVPPAYATPANTPVHLVVCASLASRQLLARVFFCPSHTYTSHAYPPTKQTRPRAPRGSTWPWRANGASLSTAGLRASGGSLGTCSRSGS